ncbi:cilia- and flagella-associated protein 221 [Amblyraja radiata]|uniref:cilia- and flagella-associated protein 221 n=1 Tax=Amblyraja radiata TaxID=386614 RepID=UPI001403E3EC|nr:cilia- and flagella-associated protein 221 [Amblyraja radiata]
MEVENHAVLQLSNHGQALMKPAILPIDRLVEEPKHGDVPNHLLETKIYNTLQSNTTIKAIPAVLHFGGFEIGKHHQQHLKLLNISSATTNIHILTPQTKYFQIKYTKKNHLVPGMSFIVTVDFCPNEWRYYYDSIRIHCKEDETLLVPVHAYPVANIVDFPTYLSIIEVSLGQSKDIIIPLRCSCPVDFEFQLSCPQMHPAFKIQPTSGIIPADEQIDLVVTYTPTNRAMAQIEVQLIVSEFNTKPYKCIIVGNYSPGIKFMPHAEHEESKDITTRKLLDPRSISPIQISRKKRHQKKVLDHTVGKLQEIKFPADLSNPHAVALVLNQKPGKLRIKDLREALAHVQGASQGRQAKEAMFNQKVNNIVKSEKANQLQWQSHLGRDPISPEAKQLILENRHQADEEYKVSMDVHVPENEYQRQKTKISLIRVLRSVGQFPSCTPQFDPYTNDPWDVRKRNLKRFQLAARKVIIQCRVNHRLILLRKPVEERKTQTGLIHFNDNNRVAVDYSDQETEKFQANLSMDKPLPFTFPFYVSPDWSDELAANALGSVPVKPSEVRINRVVPYFNLKAFHHSQIMNYVSYSAQYTSLRYVPLTLARPLRTGAEDECIIISPPGKKQIEIETDTHLDKQRTRKASGKDEDFFAGTLTIIPPEGLLKHPGYHPLYVFNLVPDLCTFKSPLSFAETDLEFHLCPLPRYIIDSKDGSKFASTQKKFLDRDDIIKGLMIWKRFPSAALKSLTTTDFFTSSWVPQWNDPFPRDMLPINTPFQMDYKLNENMDNAHLESSEGVLLTPEMLEAEFTMIQYLLSESAIFEPEPEDDKNAKLKTSQILPPVQPTSREIREEQLEISLQVQNNRLGSNIQMRIERLKRLSINKLLLLN